MMHGKGRGLWRSVIRGPLVAGLAILGWVFGTQDARGQAVTGSGQAAVTAPKVCPPPAPPTNPTSAYTLNTPAITLRYTVECNPATGAISLRPAARAARNAKQGGGGPTANGGGAESLEIDWATASGAPPADWILVSFRVTCDGVTGTFESNAPVPRTDGSFKVPLGDFGNKLIEQLRGVVCARSGSSELSCEAVVTVTPYVLVAAPGPDAGRPPARDLPAPDRAPKVSTFIYEKGKPVQTTNNLPIDLQQVLPGGDFDVLPPPQAGAAGSATKE